MTGATENNSESPIPPAGSSPHPAVAIYADFLQQTFRKEACSFEELCAAYPQYASEFEKLHDGQQTVVAPEGAVSDASDMDLFAGKPTGDTIAARRYQVQGTLGQGGMGVVYKVWDPNLNRELAMKQIRRRKSENSHQPAAGADPVLLARFVREAEITAQLDHPGIVPIHDMATDEQGLVYFTMRLVQGQRLDVVYDLSRENRERWTQTRVLDVIVKVCETVAFAHSKWIIHRDLKPTNIMVGRYGETYVLDWGLAKNIRRSESIPLTESHPDGVASATSGDSHSGSWSDTNDGSVLGTAPYMSPEQAAGKVEWIDERSDVYSVGAMLYELLTGQAPYVPRGTRRGSREVVSAVIEGPPTSLFRLNPRIAAELVTICERAMARNREARYPTMREMAEDLRAYLENRVVRSHRTGALAEFRKWMVRNRGAAISGFAAILVMVGGLAAVAWVEQAANERLSDANTREVELRRTAESQKNRVEGLLLARYSDEVLASNPTQALLLAIESYDRNPDISARNALLATLPAHFESRTLFGHEHPVDRAAVSSNGRHVVTIGKQGEAIVWDVATGRELRRLKRAKPAILHIAFHPDGFRFATASMDGTVTLWDISTEQPLGTFGTSEKWARHVAFSPDGSLVAAAWDDGAIRVYETETRNPKQEFALPGTSALQVSFNKAGTKLLMRPKSGKIQIRDLSRSSTWEFPAEFPSPSIAAFHPTRDEVLLARLDQQAHCSVTIWNSDADRPKVTIEHLSPVTSATFSHQGKWIATASAGEGIHLWDSGERIRIRDLGSVKGEIRMVKFSPDDRLIAGVVDDKFVWVWDVDTGRILAKFLSHLDSVTSLNFLSANQLVTTSSDKTARIWNVRSPGTMETPLAEVGAISGGTSPKVTLSAAGDRLVVVPVGSDTALLCRIPHGNRVASLQHESLVQEVIFSHDGKFIATLTAGNDVAIWSSETGRLLTKLPTAVRALSLCFTNESRLVVEATERGADPVKSRVVSIWNSSPVSGSDQFVETQRIDFAGMDFVRRSPESRIALAWSQRSLDAELRNLGDGSRIATLSALRRDEHDPLSVAFSPQGDVVATWSLYQPGTKLWDTASGRSIHVIDDDDGSLDRVEFSSDGSLLVTTSGSHGIRLWEGKTGNSRPSWNSVQPTTGLILSGPLGHRFLVESPEEGILLINGDSGQRIQRLGNVDERIGLVQFSTTCEFLLTATSSREELVIWNAVTGDRLATVRQTDRPFVRAEFTHDGQWIVTCEQDGTTRVWPMDVAGFAKRHVPRDLYSAERELFGIK